MKHHDIELQTCFIYKYRVIVVCLFVCMGFCKWKSDRMKEKFVDYCNLPKNVYIVV